MYTVKTARGLLPKLGEQRWERPTVCKEATGLNKAFAHPHQRCVVVYVHPEHLWYTVQFEDGTRESYNVPKVRPQSGGPAV